ncbi:MAG: hypothetical protein WCR67_08070, partial [Bacilli bacterium]
GTGITNISKINHNAPEVYFWHNRKYIKVDGIFSIIISNKGNVYRIRNIGDSKISYLVTNGENKWSHGNTLKEAKEDLIFKISNRDKSKYENLTLDSELTFEESIEAYRIITGACSMGTKDFVINRLKEKKGKYKICEIINLTKDNYGNKIFSDYFKIKR